MKIIEGRVRLAASDVANFLACRRLTQLDLLRARGELRPPREFDIGFQELVRRGEEHERAVLARFRADGPGRRGRQRGAGRGRSDKRSHRGQGRGRLPGDAGRRRARGGAVRAAGFPGPGGPAARAGRGAAAGRDALRGRGRQAGPVGEGPRGAADRVLLASAGRRAADRAAVDAPCAGQRRVLPRPAGGPGRRDGQPDRVRGGARGRDRGRGRRAAAGRGRVQRGRLPGHAGAAGLAGGTAGRAGRTAGRGAAAAGLRGEGRGPPGIPRPPGSVRRCWPASPRRRARGGRGRCWPTCSTGTGARTSRPGGGTSTSAR